MVIITVGGPLYLFEGSRVLPFPPPSHVYMDLTN